MNGSTKGTMGFNLEVSIKLLNSINYSCTTTARLVSDVFEDLEALIFTNWYSPSAVSFEKKVLVPAKLELRKFIGKSYLQAFDAVKNAVNRWCEVTGQGKPGVSFENQVLISGTPGYSQKSKTTDAKGNCFINTKLNEKLKAYMSSAKYNKFRAGLEEGIAACKKNNYSFLDDRSKATVNSVLNSIEKQIKNSFAAILNKLSAEVEKETIAIKSASAKATSILSSK